MMEQTKHTPGPWKVCESDNKEIDGWFCVFDENTEAPDLSVAICNYSGGDEPLDVARAKAAANARLIAAAPNLLECLIEMDVERTERDGADWIKHPLYLKVQAAIARAAGNR
jgi:hypothetical protein